MRGWKRLIPANWHSRGLAVEHTRELSVRSLSSDPAVLIAEMAEWLKALPSDAKVKLVCGDRRAYHSWHYWQATWWRKAIETDEVAG